MSRRVLALVPHHEGSFEEMVHRARSLTGLTRVSTRSALPSPRA